MKLSDLDLTARRQHGLVTLDQWNDHGGSRGAWYRALIDGRLLPVHPYVARLPGNGLDATASILAALFALDGATTPASRRRAVPSHTSAARVLGAEVADELVHLTLTRRGVRPQLAGVLLHRPRDASSIRSVHADGIRVTEPARTIIDCASVLPRGDLGVVVEGLLLNGRLSLGRLERHLTPNRRQGSKGAAALHQLLSEVGRWAKPPDSLLEVRFAELLAAHELPAARFHHVAMAGARSFELDFAYLGGRAQLDLEVDGWASHGSRRAFEQNRDRDAWLQAAGWIVQRFTWFQVAERPGFVAGVVRDLLSRHGHLT